MSTTGNGVTMAQILQQLQALGSADVDVSATDNSVQPALAELSQMADELPLDLTEDAEDDEDADDFTILEEADIDPAYSREIINNDVDIEGVDVEDDMPEGDMDEIVLDVGQDDLAEEIHIDDEADLATNHTDELWQALGALDGSQPIGNSQRDWDNMGEILSMMSNGLQEDEHDMAPVMGEEVVVIQDDIMPDVEPLNDEILEDRMELEDELENAILDEEAIPDEDEIETFIENSPDADPIILQLGQDDELQVQAVPVGLQPVDTISVDEIVAVQPIETVDTQPIVMQTADEPIVLQTEPAQVVIADQAEINDQIQAMIAQLNATGNFEEMGEDVEPDFVNPYPNLSLMEIPDLKARQMWNDPEFTFMTEDTQTGTGYDSQSATSLSDLSAKLTEIEQNIYTNPSTHSQSHSKSKSQSSQKSVSPSKSHSLSISKSKSVSQSKIAPENPGISDIFAEDGMDAASTTVVVPDVNTIFVPKNVQEVQQALMQNNGSVEVVQPKEGQIAPAIEQMIFDTFTEEANDFQLALPKVPPNAAREAKLDTLEFAIGNALHAKQTRLSYLARQFNDALGSNFFQIPAYNENMQEYRQFYLTLGQLSTSQLDVLNRLSLSGPQMTAYKELRNVRGPRAKVAEFDRKLQRYIQLPSALTYQPRPFRQSQDFFKIAARQPVLTTRRQAPPTWM